ncbi:MAG: hypothetical protein EXS24_02270 [Pedosphaera sp.]|nr:hypothetical protein [Pedosphaera sp.]
MNRTYVLFVAALTALPVTTTFAGDWAQWRGAARDGVAKGESKLDRLPTKTDAAWSLPTGKGQAGMVAAQGKLVILHEVDGKEAVKLVELQTGKQVWEVSVGDSWNFTNEYGSGPRCTPVIDGDLIFVQTAKGVLACVQLKDGKILWSTDYDKNFGATFFGGNIPGSEGTAARRHGNNGSPVVDDKWIYAPVGSPDGASLVAFDKRTGKVRWKSGNDNAAYSSLMLATIGGEAQVIVVTADRLIGTRCEDGKILWDTPVKTGAQRNVVTPIIVGDTVTIASSTVGLVQYRVSKEGGKFQVAEAWANRQLKINLTTPVLLAGHLYGLGSSKGNSSEFVCVNFGSGTVLWSKPGYTDYSSVIGVGDRLLVHNSSGELCLLRASPEKYEELGRLQVCGRTWSFPAYSGGWLIVKDARQTIAVPLVQ